jgi:hypothetical protein
MENMRVAVLDYIRKNDCVMHPEIEWIFSKRGFDYRVDLMDCSSLCWNVIFWGWNQAAYDIMQELLQDGLVDRDAAPPIVILSMGKGLNLPRVKRNVQYQTLHRLPVMYRPVRKKTGRAHEQT